MFWSCLEFLAVLGVGLETANLSALSGWAADILAAALACLKHTRHAPGPGQNPAMLAPAKPLQGADDGGGSVTSGGYGHLALECFCRISGPDGVRAEVEVALVVVGPKFSRDVLGQAPQRTQWYELPPQSSGCVVQPRINTHERREVAATVQAQNCCWNPKPSIAQASSPRVSRR